MSNSDVACRVIEYKITKLKSIVNRLNRDSIQHMFLSVDALQQAREIEDEISVLELKLELEQSKSK